MRHTARIIALQTLYEFDCAGHKPKPVLERLAKEKSLPGEVVFFAQELVQGVMANKDRLDALIQTYAPSFPVTQLSAIDRNILRLAIFELQFHGKVLPKVAINEAVELAKAFGSDSSSRFINGVLGAVVAAMS